MFDKLQQLKGMGKMGGKMLGLQRQLMKLSKQKTEVKEGSVQVVIIGSQLTRNQKVKVLEIEGESQEELKEAINRALSQSQDSILSKLQEMSGGMGGLLGG